MIMGHYYSVTLLVFLSFFFFFRTVFRSCYPGWSAMARSRLTATSASWVQASLLLQPPKWLESQACATTPSNFVFFKIETGFLHAGQAGLKLPTLGDPLTSASQMLGLQM